MKRPLIGITAERSSLPGRGDEAYFVTPENFFRLIEKAGGVAILIPNASQPDVLQSVFESLDGLLLGGGEDIHPAQYHHAPDPQLQTTFDARDQTERTLLQWAFEYHLPILGICRGLQMLNVHLGGTLHQDLPSALGSDTIHQGSDADSNKFKHSMKLDPKSQLAGILGTESIQVNNLHHQGIKDLSPKLRAVGWADDDLIEAVEYPGERFALAVQCHPECLWPDTDARWLRLFEEFVQASREYGSSVRREYQALVAYAG